MPVIYKGPAATEQRIQQFEKNIKDKWSGRIGSDSVEVFFIPGGMKVGRGTILVGNIVFMDSGGAGIRSFFDPNIGLLAWNVDSPDAPGHEFGHVMRNSLHYDRPHDGYEENIMIKNTGGVEPINIYEAEDAWGGMNASGFVAPPGVR
ncbi:MAG: hypothetical protein KBF26_02945 [Opitutaceae bacterium]|nr:hypothetical protein [Opitutaceae bacterium]